MAEKVKVKEKGPEVHVHQDSGLRYLLGKDNVLFDNSVKIPRSEFEKLKGVPGALKERISECLASKPRNCGWDWKYACTTGNLRRKKGNGTLEVNARTARHRARQAEEDAKALTEEQRKDALREYLSSSAFLVTAVMAIVGVGSAIMSAYHTSSFLYQGGKPLWASVMTGVMLILFSGTAFTAARYFFQEKGALCVFGWLFVVAGLAVIAYSMFSTLTVNFNQFKWKDDKAATTAVADSEALLAHTHIIEETRSTLEETGREIARLEGEADFWRERTWRRYDEFNEQLAAAIERRDTLRAELVRLEAEKPTLVEEAAVSRETVYSFLARLAGLPEDTARFFVYVVPACLYDVLAPFALSVVLLLADKRRKQKGV